MFVSLSNDCVILAMDKPSPLPSVLGSAESSLVASLAAQAPASLGESGNCSRARGTHPGVGWSRVWLGVRHCL